MPMLMITAGKTVDGEYQASHFLSFVGWCKIDSEEYWPLEYETYEDAQRMIACVWVVEGLTMRISTYKTKR